jgi:hypothetical protein
MRRKFRRIFEKEKGSNASYRGKNREKLYQLHTRRGCAASMHHDLAATNMTFENIVIQSR